MIEIEFTNVNYTAIKQSWENWLDKGWHPGIMTDFDDKMGKGVLLLLELEKGLTVVMNDNTAKDDLLFINKAYTSATNFMFTLDYLVQGNVYVVENKNAGEAKNYPILNKVVLHHSKSNFSFLASKGIRAKVIDIIFSHEWLLSQFPFSQQQLIREKILKIESLRHFYLDPISAKASEFVRQILDNIFYDEWNYVFLKHRILFLIGEFVDTHILPKGDEYQKPDDRNLLSMIQIKQRIDATLYEKLPNRKTLAKEFLTSESTLDRHFKQSFGKTINEYHLYEKMELARRILKRNGYTISQVAYLLGYETVSAFIKSFKKHFGVSPGSLRRIDIV